MSNPLLNKAMAAYASANSTLSPLLAVVRLFEKGAANLHAAQSLIKAKQFILAAAEIDRVIAICAGLEAVVVDVEGDDIGDQLSRFYVVMIDQLGSIMASADPLVAAETITRQWTQMLDAWRDVAQVGSPASPAVGAADVPAQTSEQAVNLSGI